MAFEVESVSPVWEVGWGGKFVLVISFVVLVLGIVGNLLIIIVKLRTWERRLADSAYLIIIAFADLLDLVLGIPSQLYWFITHHDPKDLSLGACHVLHYGALSIATITSWVLVALNIERCSIVRQPLAKRRTWKSAASVTFSIAVSTLIVNSWLFRALHLGDDADGDTFCLPKQDYMELYSILHPWLNLLTHSLVPTAIFAAVLVFLGRMVKTGNTVDFEALSLSTRHEVPELSLGNEPENSPLRGIVHEGYDVNNSADIDNAAETGDKASFDKKKKQKQKTQAARLTRHIDAHVKATFLFLLIIDLSLFLLVLPLDIFLLYSFHSELLVADMVTYDWHLKFATLTLWANIHNAIKFYIYFGLSLSFRKSVQRLLLRHPEPLRPVIRLN